MRRPFLAGAVAAVALVPAAAAATVTVNVRMTETTVFFSRASIPVGTARFVVLNAGTRPRAFVVANRRTKVLRPGQRATINVRFGRAGVHRYTVATVGGRVRHGTFRVAPAPPTRQPPAAPSLTELGRFAMPTDVDAPPGDGRRLVVVEQSGLIHLLVDGERTEAPFLDLRDRVRAEGEAGLLSVAFAPDYTESGLLYVFYNGVSGNLNIVEFQRDADDADRVHPGSGRPIFRQVKFAANHNGGMLQFGADGALYAAIGDGGTTPEIKPGLFAQSTEVVWGKILRLDPRTGDVVIVARGLRNPWRFWIDGVTGDTWIGDVGQDQREEVNVMPRGASGLNFGWPCFEGTLVYDATERCEGPVAPLYEYAHGPGACSITGGVVVRDPRFPTLAGAYVFGDFCGSALRLLRRPGAAASVTDLGLAVSRPISFGVDALGRVHVGSVSGSVYRIDPAP